MNDREQLNALRLATELHHNIDSDSGESYTSIGVRTNEDATDLVLEWLREHDRAVAEKAWDDGYCAVPAEPEDRELFVEDAPNPHRPQTADVLPEGGSK